MPETTIDNFHRNGLAISNTKLTPDQFALLKREYDKAQQAKPTWHYHQLAGIHNPWGKSARLFNSWGLLDICQSDTLKELLIPLLGADIILWESTFYGYAAFAPPGIWTRHTAFSPIEPMAGVSVRIALDPDGLQLDYVPGSHCDKPGENRAQPQTISIEAGTMLCHDIRLAHRYTQPLTALPGVEYVIHYMPASSLLVRDPSHPAQRLFAEYLPLLNYTKSPIWQVCGEDRNHNDFVTGFSPPVGQWATSAL